MEECGNMKHNDNNYNETDPGLDTMIKEKEKCPNITSLNLMEECGNMKQDDNNWNENDNSMDTTKKGKVNSQISHPQV